MSDHPVLAAEQARCAAMLANDGNALAALLDDRLSFHHSSGAVDDKPAYLAKMAAGTISYVSIDWSESKLTALTPGTALLTGRMDTVVNVAGERKDLANRVLEAWARSDDAAWRMVAFQSTLLKV